MDRDYEAFISYRHRECNPLAKALHDELLEAYSINSFRDDEGLHFGDFRVQLIKNNKRSKYLVLLLTPETLERCNQPDDWITKEVSLFLERKKPIIPVKLKGFEFPNNLPEAIEKLREHDFRSIRCDIDDPCMAASMIAGRVNEILREGWKEERIAECVEKKPYLSKENLTTGGYFAESVNKLRNTVFYLIPMLALVIGYWLLSFRVEKGTLLYGGAYSGFVIFFAMISPLLFFLEHKKVLDPDTGRKIPFSIHWMDHSEIGAIGQVWGWIVALLLVFAIVVTVLSFVSLILSVVAAQFIFPGIKPPSTAEDIWCLCSFSSFLLIPCIRLVIKAFLELLHFINSVFSRYPARYLRWRRITVAQKVWRIVGWIIIIPAAIVLGAVLLRIVKVV